MRFSGLAAIPAIVLLALAQPSPAQPPAAAPTPRPCDPGAAVKFVCGVRNPEDLVLIPGTDWIVGSQWIMAGQQGPGGLFLIDRKTHTATVLPAPAGKARKPFADCPGPPAFATLSTHGLGLRRAGRGKFTLYAVGHGGREGIEVFDGTVPRAGPPTVSWAGCIPSPGGTVMNAVVPLSGGRLIATEFYRPPLTLADAQRGTMTGGVYLWKPGGAFEKLPGTDLAGGNGLEVTPDGKYVFAAEWGKSIIKRYELADTTRPAWFMQLPFRIDNVRWAPDGKLLMAGPGAAPTCAPGARCPMIPMVGELDPATLNVTYLKQGPTEPAMGAISTALIVGDELWTGSYGGDRVAYQPAPK
ncbi:MAG: hypothetical protein WCI21_06875 [Alphaproteobacteria bacterium]